LPVAAVDEDFTLREALRTRAYWLIGMGIALVMFCGGAVNFHQIPHLEDQGLTRTQAAFTVTVFSSLGAIGGLIGGAIATRATVRWTLVASLVGQAFGILLLINASTLVGAMVYAVTYGVFFGSVVTMEQVVYADYFGRRSLGVIRGSFQPVQMTFNAVGPFAVGLWYERTSSYSAAFAAFAVLFLIAALTMALSPYPGRPPGATGGGESVDPAS
jgi:MFS-type transporter involved in bile tolerance (Atg22 family)